MRWYSVINRQVASPNMAASCVVPQATLFGLPLWVVVIVFGACAAFLLLAASIVHAHIVARYDCDKDFRRVLLTLISLWNAVSICAQSATKER